MNQMTNNDYYRAVLLGFVIGMASLSLIVQISTRWDVKPAEALEPKGNFEIVDTYRGCDVVRYTNDYMATYEYFLDCTDSMRNK
jgi:hypothetical protein